MDREKPKAQQTPGRTKTLVIRGLFFIWLGRGCSFLITFVVTPILILGLGNTAYGIWAIVMSVGSYYAIADIGLMGASVKYISQFEAVDDTAALNRIVATGLVVYSILAGIVMLIAIPVAWSFPHLFGLHDPALAQDGGFSVNEAQWAVLLIGITIGIRLTGQAFDATLRALKRFDIANTVSIVTQLIQATLMVIAVTTGLGLVGMAFAVLLVTFLERLTKLVIAKRLLPDLSLRLKQFDKKSLKMLFTFSSLNMIRNISSRLANYSGPIIAGACISPAVVPFFAVGESLVGKARLLTKGISGIVLPVASQLHAQKRRDDLMRMLIIVPRLMVTAAMISAVVLITMGEPFVNYWINEEFGPPTYPIMCILAASFVASMVSGGLRSILAGVDKVGLVAKIAMANAIATIVLAIVLVQYLGLPGIALGVLIPNVVTGVFVVPAYCCKFYELTWLSYMRQTVVPATLAVAPCLVVALALTHLAPATNLLYVLCEIACVLIVGAFGAFLIAMDAELRGDILRTIRRRKAAPATVPAPVAVDKIQQSG